MIPGPGGTPIVSPSCPQCARLALDAAVALAWEDAPERKQATHPNVVVAMDEVGINVRRHGHLLLEEMDRLAARTSISEWVDQVMQAGRWGEVRGLWLWGPTGTGKSQAAVCAVRALLARGIPSGRICYDRGRAMITQLQDRYSRGDVDAYSQRRRRAAVWIYEDAGTEKLTPDAFRVLEDILDAREGHPTIITTNHSRDAFVKRWSEVEGWERLRSRLVPFTPVEFDGKDLRFA